MNQHFLVLMKCGHTFQVSAVTSLKVAPGTTKADYNPADGIFGSVLPSRCCPGDHTATALKPIATTHRYPWADHPESEALRKSNGS